jgi:hypothetical protein
MSPRSLIIGVVLIGVGFVVGYSVGSGRAEPPPPAPIVLPPALSVTAVASAAPCVPVVDAGAPDAGPPRNEGPPIPAPPDVTELLGGLKTGDTIAKVWKVEDVYIPRAGALAKSVVIDLKQGKKRTLKVSMSSKGVSPYSPFMQTEQYAIYYSASASEGDGGLEDDVEQALKAIQARVMKAEKTVPRPSLL